MYRQRTARSTHRNRIEVPDRGRAHKPAAFPRGTIGTQRANPAAFGTAAGLLIPQLAPETPRSVTIEIAHAAQRGSLSRLPGVDWEQKVVDAMIGAGVLQVTDRFRSLSDAIESGFTRLIPESLRSIDYEEESALQICQSGENPVEFDVSFQPDPIYYPFYFGVLNDWLNEIAAKSRVDRVPTWGLSVCLNSGFIGMPYAWLDIDGFYSGVGADDFKDGDEEDEDNERAAKHFSDAPTYSKYHKGPLNILERAERARFSAREATRCEDAVRQHAPALADLLSQISKHSAQRRSRPTDGILCCAYWKPGDVISHGWDYMKHLLSRGELDNTDDPITRIVAPVPDIAAHFKVLGPQLESVFKLHKLISKPRKCTSNRRTTARST